MRFSRPLRMSLTRRGEKERRLGDFIGQYLAGTRSAESRPGHALRLIARSMESPVVKALAAFVPEMEAGACSLRMILARPDPEALAQGWAFADAGAVDCEVRWARNPPLIEAHEQLVLGPRACWIGDSMRRDPVKCDAIESFIDDCAEEAASAIASFERLWMASEPLVWHRHVACESGRPDAPERRL